MLNIAIRAARAAGDIIVQQMDRVGHIQMQKKNRNNFVAEIDQYVEQAIINTIKNTYPGHAFLGEETGANGNSDYEWIIDPLDGTTNYLHGFPQFAVSIALRHKKQLDQAVIYDPLRQELFTASRGGGAQLNNKRIRIGQRNTLSKALLGIGFPLKDPALLEASLDSFRAFASMAVSVRCAGAAALDLAYLACSRLDGVWGLRLKIWDIAAGALLIKEAGGMVSDIDGSDAYLDTGNIIAANPVLLKLMLAELNVR